MVNSIVATLYRYLYVYPRKKFVKIYDFSTIQVRIFS